MLTLTHDDLRAQVKLEVDDPVLEAQLVRYAESAEALIEGILQRSLTEIYESHGYAFPADIKQAVRALVATWDGTREIVEPKNMDGLMYLISHHRRLV